MSHDPYQALRYRDYRLLLAGNLVANVGSQMVALAIGWELYQRTNSALALGLVGLVQLLPVLAFALIAGHIADNRGRKKVVIVTQYAIAASSLGLAALSYWQGPLAAVYLCLLFRGVGAAFNGPALRALPAEVIPEAAYENAMSWRNTVFQGSSIVGPALGGLLIAAFGGAAPVYLIGALTGIAFVAALYPIRGNPAARRRGAPQPLTLRSLGEGIGFLRRTPIIVVQGAIDDLRID
jgi:MFS family permease